MKKNKLLLLALTSTVCLTGCFDKYNDELTAEQAKNICQAIIDNSKRADFELPSLYAIDANIVYESGAEKSDIKGQLIINEAKTFIYLDVNVKEGAATTYTHSRYFLYDDVENNSYLVGIDKDGEKKANYNDKTTHTKEEMFNAARNEVSGTGKDWIVQSQVLELLINSLLIDGFVKGLHIAENLPDLSFIKKVKELGINEYTCSLKSDGELNIDIVYKFNIGIIDTDITASWKDGYLQKGKIDVKNESGYSKGEVKEISSEPFKPDITDYTIYHL